MIRTLPEHWKVTYQHEHGYDRVFPSRLADGPAINQGHSTVARIFDEKDEIVSVGVAMCCPKDQFSKRLGRIIALGRALKYAEAMRSDYRRSIH